MSDKLQVPQGMGCHAAVVEALMFVGGPPLEPARLAELADATDEGSIIAAVSYLNRYYFQQGRPYEIRRVRSGFQMTLRREFGPIARRLQRRSREVRLSVAAIEVLSIIAYNQPVPLQSIESTRGVDSAAIVRQLRRRNLVEQCNAPDAAAKTPHYKTTKRFLELFHLANLSDLPRVQDLERA